MTHRLDPHRICTEREYFEARMDLDALLGTAGDLPDERVDELLELIETYEAATRFVPDWSGESYKSAA